MPRAKFGSGTGDSLASLEGRYAEDTSDFNDVDPFWGATIPKDKVLTIFDSNGDGYAYSYRDWLLNSDVLPRGLTWGDYVQFKSKWTSNLDAFAGVGGGGGGRGGAGPTYQAPDERLVRDAVKGVMASLVGKVDAGNLDEHVSLFMSEARRAFDSKDRQVDPMASVVERIRQSDRYKTVHAARPEEMDEETWVSGRVAQLINAGLSPSVAQELGVAQATAGATPQTVQQAGESKALASTGRMLESHRNRMRESIFAALSLA